MNERDWRGAVPESKSIALRDAVIASHREAPPAADPGAADDIRDTVAGLRALLTGATARSIAGAAPLRFLALRASRIVGDHRIEGHPTLFARPIAPLVDVLHRLGVDATPCANALEIAVRGPWRLDRPIRVDTTVSSQFASAVALNAWGLPASLTLQPYGDPVSAPYWRMTLARCRAAGMEIDETDDAVVIPAEQRAAPGLAPSEPDASAAFALAAIAVLTAPVRLDRIATESLQPDARFPTLLRTMGAAITTDDHSLHIAPAPRLQPIDADLRNAPDLFCVLATLCAFANGASRLTGAPHLRAKESDRIARTAELLRGLGRAVEERDDGLAIVGRPGIDGVAPFTFDAAPDHRLAMAAGVARAAGAPVTIENAHVVSKSFPRFFEVIACDRA